jgi:manganese/zinc/iron transport system ATP- binding protein
VTLWYSRRRYSQPLAGAPALRISNLRVAHPGAGHAALEGCSFEVQSGARVALVGPNGAGKSTLLKAIAGLLPAQSGTISIFGLPVGACHHRVAYLPQRDEIDWRFPVTVRRLVLGGRYVHIGWLRGPSTADRDIVDETLAQLGICHLAERQIGELSGGQQQRALLARALAQEADLLLLDEPFNAVDASTRESIIAILDQQQRAGRTVIVATHELDRLADEFDRVVSLRDGRIVADVAATQYRRAAGRSPRAGDAGRLESRVA